MPRRQGTRDTARAARRRWRSDYPRWWTLLRRPSGRRRARPFGSLGSTRWCGSCASPSSSSWTCALAGAPARRAVPARRLAFCREARGTVFSAELSPSTLESARPKRLTLSAPRVSPRAPPPPTTQVAACPPPVCRPRIHHRTLRYAIRGTKGCSYELFLRISPEHQESLRSPLRCLKQADASV